jgi:hypothetical protein
MKEDIKCMIKKCQPQCILKKNVSQASPSFTGVWQISAPACFLYFIFIMSHCPTPTMVRILVVLMLLSAGWAEEV